MEWLYGWFNKLLIEQYGLVIQIYCLKQTEGLA